MSEDHWDRVIRQQNEQAAADNKREMYRLQQQQATRQKEIAQERKREALARQKANTREDYLLRQKQAARQKAIRQEEYEDNVRKREAARGSHINLEVTDDDLVVAYHEAKVSLLPACNSNGNGFFTAAVACNATGVHDLNAVKEFLSKSKRFVHERYVYDVKFEKAQELELDGALYLLVGGHVKAAFAFKGYNPKSWVIKEFNWGVGGGVKGKLSGDFRPEVKKEIEPNASLYSIYDKEKIGDIDGLEAKAEATNSKAEASMSYKYNKEQQPDGTASTGVGVEGSAMFSVSVGRIGAEAGVKGELRTGVYSTYSGNPNHKKGTYKEGGIKAVIAIGLEDKDKDKLAAYRRLGAKVDLGVKVDIFEQTYKFE